MSDENHFSLTFLLSQLEFVGGPDEHEINQITGKTDINETFSDLAVEKDLVVEEEEELLNSTNQMNSPNETNSSQNVIEIEKKTGKKSPLKKRKSISSKSKDDSTLNSLSEGNENSFSNLYLL
jgi:hypothetical protein